MTNGNKTIVRFGLAVVAASLVLALGGRAEAMDKCLTPTDLINNDLTISTLCKVPGGAQLPRYRYINIVAGGTLQFEDGGVTDLWASAIIVENLGTLRAGTQTDPIGKIAGSKVTIHLWGPTTAPGAPGIPCKSDLATTCGAPATIFHGNDKGDADHTPKDKSSVVKVESLPDKGTYKGPQNDYFYAYQHLFHDEGNKDAYFGTKVLAVGYGGTLELFGNKGACTGTRCADPSYTGRSWVRLKGTATAGVQTLTVETPEGGLGWEAGDEIVVTTTDYLPGHSEQLQIKGTPTDNGNGTTTITVEQTLKYTHHGERYALPKDAGISKLGLSSELTTVGAETRAAVGLLTRSIRIVSAGSEKDGPNSLFPTEESPECKSGEGPATSKCYFGGHTIVRQGFAKVQIQGVEFFQLGQGGRIGRYPVHFHHARKTQDAAGTLPPTFVKDSSVWDSMTRWIVLHGTHDVTLQRNVGYKSVGHGFYLEDGTEINNKLVANLGVLARGAVTAVGIDRSNNYIPAVAQADNPRMVPGILAASNIADEKTKDVPWRTDVDNPTIFWIMNGWNDFQYNMAAGANVCGSCYWLVPGWNSTMSKATKWESYASMQDSPERAGTTPLKSFIGNTCTTAQIAFNTVGNLDECQGVGDPQVVSTNPKNRVVDPNVKQPYFRPISNPLAYARPTEEVPNPPKDPLGYFPSVNTGGFRKATLGDVDASGKALGFCDGSNCSATPAICAPGHEASCTITTIDGFTSSFTAAPYNFAALWLRNQWYLLQNSVITDAQNGGVNFVTGGGYSASDRIPGLWQLVYKSVFIGQTQPEANFYARNGGPFNAESFAASQLQCAYRFGPNNDPGLSAAFCLDLKEGVSFQLSNFGMGQRLLSFYDGPAVQDSNAYVTIPIRKLEDCAPVGLFVNVDCPLDQEDAVCKINCRDVTISEQKHRQCQKAVQNSGECSTSTPWTDANNIRHKESHWIAGSTLGLPKGKFLEEQKEVERCYMPNAAIAWKQPNGFYYPPAFRSRNLFFGKDVAIRHFVVEPLFVEGTLKTDLDRARTFYCKFNDGLFNGFTSNDRQTVLLDEDGSLTGYTSSYTSTPPSPLDKTTTVVNLDELLASPVEAVECLSDRTSRVTPYQYLTTVLYPATEGVARQDWSRDCTDPACYGIPIYRQDALPKQDTVSGVFTATSLRLMGQSTFQRSSITVNNGTYYLNTAVSSAEQNKTAPLHNVFQAGGAYYLFTLYAKTSTKQTYQIYVGKNATFNAQTATDVWVTQANIGADPVTFGSPIRGFAANEASYNPTTGILTVTLDHAKLSPTFTEVTKANCGPATYCHMAGDKCVDASGSDAICRWGPVDLDCPDKGCYAIGFRLPAQFVPDDGDHRPATTAKDNCIDKVKRPEWNLSLVTASDGICPAAGEPLTDDFCGSTADEISIIQGDSEPERAAE